MIRQDREISMRFVLGLAVLISAPNLAAQPYQQEEIEFRQGSELL